MSNKINFALINEIQNKADIVAVISSFIKLSRKGNNYVGICPFHADKNPSLVVSPKKKIFKCFVCNAKGNVFSFVQQYKKVPFIEAVMIVAKLAGYDDKNLHLSIGGTYLDPKIKRLVDANVQVNEWYKGFLHNPENAHALEYLSKRGIDNGIIKSFEFGYAPNTKNTLFNMLTNANNMFGVNRPKDLIWNEKELLDAGLISINQNGEIFDFFSGRITFPIYDDNRLLVGFSGRSIKPNQEPKYLNTQTSKLFSKANVLFNFYRIKSNELQKIIIVEGFMDAIAYHRAGYPNVVATMGVALTNEHLNLLRSLPNLESVTLSFDNDQAGENATIVNGTKLMENGFNTYVVGSYDKTIKDVDELIKSQGKEAIASILNNCVDYISFLINSQFINKQSIDETHKKINAIMSSMINYGDSSILFRKQHLKLLADKTGIDFDDLKEKFEKDFKKIVVNETHSNIFQLRKELPKQVEQEPETNKNDYRHSQITKNKNELLVVIKRSIEAYDKLILLLANDNSVIKDVDQKINMNASIGVNNEQKFILRAISYLINEDKDISFNVLSSFLQERSQLKNEVAKKYSEALSYLNQLKSRPLNSDHFLEKSKEKRSSQINNVIKDIQECKYMIVLKEKIIKMWDLSKDTKINQKEIDALNIDIINVNKEYNQWKNKR